MLMRKLRGEISAARAANLTLEVVEGKSGCHKSQRKYDVTGQLFMCTRCFFVCSAPYMHTVAALGVCKATEVLPKNLVDGAWARCEAFCTKLGDNGCKPMGSTYANAFRSADLEFRVAV